MSTETAIKQLVRFSAGDGRVRTWSEAHALVTAKPALTDPTSPIARAYAEYDRVGTSIVDALSKMGPDPVRKSGAVVSDPGPASAAARAQDPGRKPPRKAWTEETMEMISMRSGTPIEELRRINRRANGV